jgi:hypothetical protein
LEASAQKLLIDGVASVHSGLEGSDPEVSAMQWQRQRTRLQVGAEWSSSETKTHALALYGIFELERSGSVGAEFRYRIWMSRFVGAFAGPIALLRPESLYGVQGGLTGALPVGKDAALFAELSMAGFPLGSDRSHSGATVVWASLGLGAKIHF